MATFRGARPVGRDGGCYQKFRRNLKTTAPMGWRKVRSALWPILFILLMLTCWAGLAPKAGAQATTSTVKIVTISDCASSRPPIPNVKVTFQRMTLSGNQYVPTGPVYTVTTDANGTATTNLPNGSWHTLGDANVLQNYSVSSTPIPWSGDLSSVTVGDPISVSGPITVSFLKISPCDPSGGTPPSRVHVQVKTVQSCTEKDPVSPAPDIAVDIGNQTVTTDANGNATIELAAGPYGVLASYPSDIPSMMFAHVDLIPPNVRYKPAGESALSLTLGGSNETLVIQLYNCDVNGLRTPRARVTAITGGNIMVSRTHASGNAAVGMVLRDGDDVVVRGAASLAWLSGGTISFENPHGIVHFVIGKQAPGGTAPPPPSGVPSVNVLQGFINFWIPAGETKEHRFDASTGTVVVGVKGTRWSVAVDPQTQVTAVQVTEGEVELTPVNSSLAAFSLTAGTQVQVSQKSVGAITAIAAAIPPRAPNNPPPVTATPPTWVSTNPPTSTSPPTWISGNPPQTGASVASLWQLTSNCGNWGFPAEGANWHAMINLSEAPNGALSGTVQDDPISPKLLQTSNGYNNTTSGFTSRQSGNTVTLVLNPSGWASTLQLTGTLNGSQITGKVHHYGSDDCMFTMLRNGGALPFVSSSTTTPPKTTTPTLATTTVLNISGVWTDRNGAWVYQFTQNGANFHWQRNPPESANGVINGYQVSANWGTGSGKGRIMLDANGVAARIEWASGEVFIRQGVR